MAVSAFIYAGLQNEQVEWDYPFWKQILRVEAFILSAEFITGCIVNLWLGLNVWDYSGLPGNILGQTCPQFALLFLPLSAIAIVVDDFVRWKVLAEEKQDINGGDMGMLKDCGTNSYRRLRRCEKGIGKDFKRVGYRNK